MPLYSLITQDGAPGSDAKAKLAIELTTLHSECAGVPKNWVHIGVRCRQLADQLGLGGLCSHERDRYQTSRRREA
jgi:phenylpyruvate tautomerase PptA (4-oxalocrotonate tautomerase family)